MDRPNLQKKSTYVKIKEACEFILYSQGKTSSTVSLNSAELFQKVKNEFPDDFPQDFQKNTFYQYLSNTVKDTDSSINCLGRRKGYYLSSISPVTKTDEVQEVAGTTGDQGAMVSPEGEEVPSAKRVQKEILLYPHLETWLIAQGYQTGDVSSGRSLGKWGNPDVAGISALDAFNGLSIELVTIEAKISLDNWEQWIFEAISHRRFANRAYFAFAHPEETASKIPQDMRYYAELYNIGVLVISMDNDKYDDLQAGNLTEIDPEDVEVIEVFSAPYNFVQPKYQLKFCTAALGITCIKELYRWGEN